MRLNLQMFGGRGGSSGSGGGSGDSGVPKYLSEDVYRMYKITITEGSKTREQHVYSTAWEIKNRELNFMEGHDLTYSQYMRQSRYSFMATQYAGDNVKVENMKDVYKEAGARKEYERRKKEFFARWKKIAGNKK